MSEFEEQTRSDTNDGAKPTVFVDGKGYTGKDVPKTPRPEAQK